MTPKTPYETVKADFCCPACGWTNLPTELMCILGPWAYAINRPHVDDQHPRARRIICSGCERVFYERDPEKILFVNDEDHQYLLEIEPENHDEQQ